MFQPDLPNHFLTEKQFDSLLSSEIDYIIPYSFEIEENSNQYIHSLLWVDDGILVTAYFDPEQKIWKDKSTEHLHNPVSAEWESPWVGNLVFTGDDVDKANECMESLSRRVNSFYPKAVIPNDDVDHREYGEFKSQSDCDCSGLSSDSVSRGSPELTDLDYQPLICMECLQLHGLFIGGKNYSFDEIVKEDWILEEMPDDIVEIDQQEEYLLYSSGNSVTRTGQIIGALTFRGTFEQTVFSDYNPDEHKALLYIRDGEAAGFLTWGKLDDVDIVRQVYVRNDHRQNGVATRLARTWRDHFRDSTTYYLDDPNEGGRALFDRIGDLEAGDEPRATKWNDLNPVQANVNQSGFWRDMQTTYGLPPLE